MPGFLRALLEHDPPSVSWTEQWRAGLGAMLAIVLTGLLTHGLAPQLSVWLVAPMGASAVLLLALPASPLTQPWAVIGGNTLSALVGLLVSQSRLPPDLATGVAVGLALLTMFVMRCLHPPGGAVALLMVLTQAHDWRMALAPVLPNSLVLVLLATAYNRMTGRHYPHPRAQAPSPEGHSLRITSDDLEAAMRHDNQVIDMDRQDLQGLLRDAQAHAYQRTLGQWRCSDIMSTTRVAVRAHDPLLHAWALLMENDIQSLPVVDEAGHVTGIITRTDFIVPGHGLRGPGTENAMALDSATVEQWMSRQVRVVSDTARMVDLLPIFAHEGHHHLPVVNADQVLVGMLTESDVVRALAQALT